MRPWMFLLVGPLFVAALAFVRWELGVIGVAALTTYAVVVGLRLRRMERRAQRGMQEIANRPERKGWEE